MSAPKGRGPQGRVILVPAGASHPSRRCNRAFTTACDALHVLHVQWLVALPGLNGLVLDTTVVDFLHNNRWLVCVSACTRVDIGVDSNALAGAVNMFAVMNLIQLIESGRLKQELAMGARSLLAKLTVTLPHRPVRHSICTPPSTPMSSTSAGRAANRPTVTTPASWFSSRSSETGSSICRS